MLLRPLFCTLLALNLAEILTADKPVKSTRNLKEIAPVFRRNPYRSSSTTSKPSTTENTTSEDTSEATVTSQSEEDNEFYVGREHYYDNRIDIQKENDEAEIEEESPQISEVTEVKITPDLKASETSDELVYDNDEYYYEDYEESDSEYFLRQQRQERLKRLQERRRAWLRNQREKYFKSLTRWRRPKVVKVKDSYRQRPNVRHYHRPHRPPRPLKAEKASEENRRHYESQNPTMRNSGGESTSLMRSLLGVSPFCVHDDAQFSCTFTPYCWMKGGVAMSGCDSMLYSCCVSHTIARRQVRPI